MQRSNRSGHIISNISGIKKVKVRWGSGTMFLGKREGRFIEDDVLRYDDSVGGEVKASVSFVALQEMYDFLTYLV